MVSSVPVIAPLVVRVLLAHRKLVRDDVRTTTTASSADVDDNATSTRS